MGFQPATLFAPSQVLAVLEFWVPGRPQTAGSKSAFVNPKTGKAIVTESGSSAVKARKRTWRGDLRDAGEHARSETWGTGRPVDVPLWAHFVFARPRPSTHVGSGRNAGLLKPSAVGMRPTSRPDALKLARAAEDALTGVLWLDDSQIVHETIEKVFGDELGLDPRAEGLLLRVGQAFAYSGPVVA